MVGCGCKNGLEVGDRCGVVTCCVLRIAQPETRGRHIAALRVLADEIAKRCAGFGELARTEHRQRRFKVALFSGIGLEFLAIYGDRDGLELAQALVRGFDNFFLTLLNVSDVFLQLLVLPTHLGQIGLQGLNLTLQIEQAAAQLRHFVTRALTGALIGLLQRVDALAHFQNCAPRLVIFEQGCMRRGGHEGTHAKRSGNPRSVWRKRALHH